MSNDKNLLNLLWEVIDCANFYFIILDEEFNVKICNKLIVETLGYKSKSEVIGKNWLQFLPPHNREVVKLVGAKVLHDDINYGEFINEIITNEGKTILVKWFNAKVTNGHPGIMKIGVRFNDSSVDISKDANVDTVRDIWKGIVQSDRLVIKHELKEMMNKSLNDNPIQICTITEH